MNERETNSVKSIIFVFVVLIMIGTASLYVLKDLTLWNAFYQTMHLMLSHFYDYGGEGDPPLMQAMSLLLIAGSLIIVVYLFKTFGEYLIGGQLKERIHKNNMKKMITKLTEHYIICGYGRVGRQVAEEIASEEVDFVIIDKDKEALKKAEAKGYLTIVGDPTDDISLKAANLSKAKCLIAVLNQDTDNLFLTIAARGDNPDIFIVARASNESNVSKMEKAGADKVALPYKIGGYHIATMAMRPSVVDFLDIMVDGKHDELQVEEVMIEAGSELIGKAISNSMLSRNKTKTTVLAINKADGRSLINPSGRHVMETNDKLIILGTKDSLENVAEKV